MLSEFSSIARLNWLRKLISTFSMSDAEVNVAVGADLRPFWSAQFDAMRANSFASMMFNFVFAVLVALAMQGTSLSWHAWVWALALSGASVFMLIGRRGHQRTRGGASGLLMRAMAFGILFSALWAVVPVWFSPEVTGNQRTLLFAVSIMVFSLGVFSLARVPLAAVVFAVVLAIALFVGVFRMGGGSELLGASVVVAAAISAVVLVLRFNDMSLRLARTTVANRQNKQTYRLLAKAVSQSSPIWFYQTDLHGALTVVPEELFAVSKRSADRLRGCTLAQLCEKRPQSKGWKKISEAMQARRAFAQIPVEVEIEGSARCWVLSGEPISDQAGTIAGYRCVCCDVTDEEKSRRRVAKSLAERQQSREQWEHFWGELSEQMLSQLTDVANVIALSGGGEIQGLNETTNEGLQPVIDAMLSLRLYCRLARGKVVLNDQKLDLAEMAMFGIREARNSSVNGKQVCEVASPLVEESGTLFGDMLLLKRLVVHSVLLVCRTVEHGAVVNFRVRRSGDAGIRLEIFGRGEAKSLARLMSLIKKVEAGNFHAFSPDGLHDIATMNVIRICQLHDGQISVRRSATGDVGLCISFPASRVELVSCLPIAV